MCCECWGIVAWVHAEVACVLHMITTASAYQGCRRAVQNVNELDPLPWPAHLAQSAAQRVQQYSSPLWMTMKPHIPMGLSILIWLVDTKPKLRTQSSHTYPAHALAMHQKQQRCFDQDLSSQQVPRLPCPPLLPAPTSRVAVLQ